MNSPCALSAASCLWLKEDRRMRIKAVMRPNRGLAQVKTKVSAEENQAKTCREQQIKNIDVHAKKKASVK